MKATYMDKAQEDEEKKTIRTKFVLNIIHLFRWPRI